MSPTERQVPHALLTRSPLNLISFDRNLIPLSPVRLACVRHAASVRPEPGSNSQKIVSKALIAPQIILRIICLANLLKNFRWLKFDYSKLKHFTVQGVCSSLRYSIYKVQVAVLRAGAVHWTACI